LGGILDHAVFSSQLTVSSCHDARAAIWAGNYYPSSSAAVLMRPQTTEPPRLATLQLLSAIPHGVASLADGDLELMLHRRPMEVCLSAIPERKAGHC